MAASQDFKATSELNIRHETLLINDFSCMEFQQVNPIIWKTTLLSGKKYLRKGRYIDWGTKFWVRHFFL